MGTFLSEASKAEDGDVSGRNLYLAQHPLEKSDKLCQDLHTPACLEGIPLQSTNLWMCIQGSRTNIHFDPYQVGLHRLLQPQAPALVSTTISLQHNGWQPEACCHPSRATYAQQPFALH
jgi:hypothetical protein